MSVTIEQDLKEYLQRFEQRLDRLEQKLDNLQEGMNDLKVGQAKVEEKVEGLKERIASQEFVNRGILIGLIVTILGGFDKLFGIVGNP